MNLPRFGKSLGPKPDQPDPLNVLSDSWQLAVFAAGQDNDGDPVPGIDGAAGFALGVVLETDGTAGGAVAPPGAVPGVVLTLGAASGGDPVAGPVW